MFSLLLKIASSGIKAQLHVVVLLDIDAEDFDVLSSANPALFKQCYVFWREQWTLDSLRQMPAMLLQKKEIEVTEDTASGFRLGQDGIDSSS